MRPSWKILVTVAATLLAVPQLALADEVEEQLQQMQQRMSELENKLQATNDELETSKQRVDQQQELIEKAGIDESRGAGSGSRPDFLNTIEIDGFVAASYNYNFNVLKREDLAQAGRSPATAGAPTHGVGRERRHPGPHGARPHQRQQLPARSALVRDREDGDDGEQCRLPRRHRVWRAGRRESRGHLLHDGRPAPAAARTTTERAICRTCSRPTPSIWPRSARTASPSRAAASRP